MSLPVGLPNDDRLERRTLVPKKCKPNKESFVDNSNNKMPMDKKMVIILRQKFKSLCLGLLPSSASTSTTT